VNFLAHAYLSYGNPEILTGNLMADFIRGKPLPNLPASIQNGIRLHRAIDDFTDKHEINRQAYAYLRSSSGRLAPVFLDIAYDYFLASHGYYFPNETVLSKFAHETYEKVDAQLMHTDNRFSSMYARMKEQNWLLKYRDKANMARSFNSVTYRTKLITNTAPVFEEFLKNENELKSAFDAFFPDLEIHVKNMLFSMA